MQSPPPKFIERVSVGADQRQADAPSAGAGLNGGGRYAVFVSTASGLVPGVKGGHRLVYVRDLLSSDTRLISAAPDGTAADGDSYGASISGNGRYVVFDSEAGNIVPGRAPDHHRDIYVRDLFTGRTERLLPGAKGPAKVSDTPSVTADGRYVAFTSERDDLVPGDTNNTWDVFVRDRLTGRTTRVSVNEKGGQSGYGGHSPVISADGSRVVFKSYQGLTADSNHGGIHGKPRARGLYAHDLRTHRTWLAGKTYQGRFLYVYETPAISGDGRYVVFKTGARVVPGENDNSDDVFVRDLDRDTVRRVSETPDGKPQNGSAWGGMAMSTDGNKVFFSSSASNLAPGGNRGIEDVFVRDLRTNTIERVSVGKGGIKANGRSSVVAVDRTGSRVLFDSEAGNLVPGDTNKVQDVFLRLLR
ncbi:hypothetical protein GCM10010218_36140 [Streptomyces mashuensis]|uniref:Uncharacterized protein n=1 Tax=Streptomyces mashuensis TaxID=33904 RepID=A0A919B4T5_9ACTN|nr:hypothetical protein GCM10010218_36140 [Streptomyces mashuensis]